ncbi:MAG: response regulator [Desulfotomaculaceae bacterium]|nr:response regulator [Desulfotomaculaceae bacterium]
MIDDNKELTEIICEVLGMIGYEATGATSGEEGIAKAKEQKPDVILCDIEMVGMNGYDIAEYIRKDNELKDVCLIAISGYSSREDVERSIETGFDRHLGKPFSLDDLKMTLDEVLIK